MKFSEICGTLFIGGGGVPFVGGNPTIWGSISGVPFLHKPSMLQSFVMLIIFIMLIKCSKCLTCL